MHLPISFATCTSLEAVREISATLKPISANSKAYCLPMPSVAPVITEICLKKSYGMKRAQHCK